MRATLFTDNWYVRREDGDGPRLGPIQLPHDAMLAEPRTPATPNRHNTGYWPGGVYRYQKTFTAPAEWADRSVTLEFEGVYCRSEVFCNGRLVGGRPNGYTLFHANLDDALEHGEENVVEVVVHNDKPSSRWYSGSGIYRPVHLLVGGPVRIVPQGQDVVTRSLVGGTAHLDVSVELQNDTQDSSGVRLDAVVTSPDGREFTASAEASLASAVHIAQLSFEIPEARTWSPDDPALHTLTTRIISDTEEVLDEAVETFGIRTLTVDATHGLRINGQTVKLRGACIHHDNGPIGAVELDDAADRRIRLLKQAGYNAIRSAHNPISKALLRACDRHGVMVMEELTDMWLRLKVVNDYSTEFPQWWERDLESMIRKARIHPSVVMYSIGNEIGETASPAGIELNRRMAERCRDLDPTRPVTNGLNGLLNLMADLDDEKAAEQSSAARAGGKNPMENLISTLNVVIGALMTVMPLIARLKKTDARTRDSFNALDVSGYNYMQSRYRRDAELHPGRVIVGSETMATDTVRIWRDVESLPTVIGDFVWTGWDYIGEASVGAPIYNEKRGLYRPWPARLAGLPLIDVTGYLQPLCYRNLLLWRLRTDPYISVRPMNRAGQRVRMSPWRPSDSVRSWTWDGHESKKATVEVYADAATVDLQLNGRIVGTAKPDANSMAATFAVPYERGELIAVARDAAGREVGRDSLSTAMPGLHLHVESESSHVRADGDSLAYLQITVGDEHGIVTTLADRPITVDVSGAGILAGFGSANPVTSEGYAGTTATSYQGRALAVIRSGAEPGEVRVRVSAVGCTPVELTLPVK